MLIYAKRNKVNRTVQTKALILLRLIENMCKREMLFRLHSLPKQTLYL